MLEIIILKFLKEKKIQHQELASRAGISRGYLSDRMKSKNDFRVTLLEKIAEIFDVSVAYLCRNDNEIVTTAHITEVIEFTRPGEIIRVEKENEGWKIKTAD